MRSDRRHLGHEALGNDLAMRGDLRGTRQWGDWIWSGVRLTGEAWLRLGHAPSWMSNTRTGGCLAVTNVRRDICVTIIPFIITSRYVLRNHVTDTQTGPLLLCVLWSLLCQSRKSSLDAEFILRLWPWLDGSAEGRLTPSLERVREHPIDVISFSSLCLFFLFLCSSPPPSVFFFCFFFFSFQLLLVSCSSCGFIFLLFVLCLLFRLSFSTSFSLPFSFSSIPYYFPSFPPSLPLPSPISSSPFLWFFSLFIPYLYEATMR